MPPQTPSTGSRAARAASRRSFSNAVRSGFVRPALRPARLAVQLRRHVEGAAGHDEPVEEREVGRRRRRGACGSRMGSPPAASTAST